MSLRAPDERDGMMTEINVTPLVDVMLVLLTVFIVTAPLIIQAIPVNLPRVAPTPALAEQRTIRISVTADGAVQVERQAVAPHRVEAALKQFGATPDASVEIHADTAAEYGQVARVMAQIQRAGIVKFAFVTLPERGAGSTPGK